MNQDEIKNLIQVVMAFFGPLMACYFHISGADWAALTTAALGCVGPLWSVAAHWNMKKVPETASMIEAGKVEVAK
jgi:hypothetical protein